jgi:iron(III) transport system ATP-binding protein
MEDPAMICANSLNKRFVTDKGQTVNALNDVTFDVTEGDFFVLLGPSGSGKTTTLRAVAGLETPDTGHLSINGQTVFSSDPAVLVAPEERPVAMVFQSYALWPHMDVTGNIAFPLRHGVRRVPEAELKKRIERVAETLELTPYLNRPISQLSGGQQQRVALARALALEPSVLLMDEPLSNLDAKLRAQLRIDLKKLTSKLGITTLYVTHDQVEAMVMGDKIAVMENGAIVEQGTPKDLYLRPQNIFVAKFLGEMNFVPGRCSGAVNGHADIQTPVGALVVPNTRQTVAGNDVRIGFRPEAIHHGRGPSDAPLGVTFQADVISTYFLGDITACELRVEDHTITANLPPTARVTAGERTEFTVGQDAFSLF